MNGMRQWEFRRRRRRGVAVPTGLQTAMEQELRMTTEARIEAENLDDDKWAGKGPQEINDVSVD